MKLVKIKIRNFKSIKAIEINCNDGINAFIGKNGTGKSAVFDAVHFVLGEDDPTKRDIKNEWSDGNEKLIRFGETEANIEILFDDSKRIICNIVETDGENTIQGTIKTQVKVLMNINENERIRYKICLVDINRKDRDINSITTSSLQKIQIRKNGADEWILKDEFVDNFNISSCKQGDVFQLKNGDCFLIQKFEGDFNEDELFTYLRTNNFIQTGEIMRGTSFLNVYSKNLPNSKVQTLSMCPFHAESSGIKNSFIITATLGKNQQSQNHNPIFIDEPELYLHPHAKKSLYNTLKKLSKCGTQIFYITHSSEFLSYEDSNEIIRFYNHHLDGTKHCNGSKITELTEIQQSIQCDKISFNNAFFADTVLLVEGYSDLLFLQYVIESKNQNKAIEDFNISIVNCGGKDNIVRFYQIYNKLNIECFALFDKDNKGDDDIQNAELSKIGYGFIDNLESFISDENKIMKDCDKANFITAWINNKINPNPKQAKIDKIYTEIIKFIPNLKKIILP